MVEVNQAGHIQLWRGIIIVVDFRSWRLSYTHIVSTNDKNKANNEAQKNPYIISE